MQTILNTRLSHFVGRLCADTACQQDSLMLVLLEFEKLLDICQEAKLINLWSLQLSCFLELRLLWCTVFNSLKSIHSGKVSRTETRILCLH